MKTFKEVFENFKKSLTEEQLKRFNECDFDPEFLEFIWEEDVKFDEEKFKTSVLDEMNELLKDPNDYEIIDDNELDS